MTTCPSDNMSTCIWTGFNRELVISASLWYKVDIIVISSKQLVFAMILQWPATNNVLKCLPAKYCFTNTIKIQLSVLVKYEEDIVIVYFIECSLFSS
jgi:hypothetical protein